MVAHLASSSLSQFIQLPFAYQIPIKLTDDNYLSWKFLILPHVKGHNLYDFLDGSISSPTHTLSTYNGSTISNPDYLQWSRQDQLLLA
jgi:gag-polypeptide of LTR copia-type